MAVRMSIPTPYIFSIDTPLLFFNGRIFQPQDKTDSNNNYIELGPNKYDLQEISSAKSLEDLYFSHNSEQFETYQSRYIQDNIQKELRSSAAIKEESTNNKVLSFIVNEVLPLITSEKLDNEIEDILVEDKLDQDRKHRRRLSRAGNAILEKLHANKQDAPNDMPVSREIMAEARRIKAEFLSKLNEQYASHERTQRRTNTRSRNLDDKVSDLLLSRNGGASRSSYGSIDDESIFSRCKNFQNMMLIGTSFYDIVSVKEFISYFKDYMKPSLYRELMSFGPDKNPLEINDFIKRNILDMDKKCRSRIRNKLRSSKININGEYFVPFLKEKSAEFRTALLENYTKLIEKKIKADSFDKYEGQTREIYEIAEERKRLHKLFESNSYERKGAGFKKIGSAYYVYVTTPAYALKSPHVSGERKYVAFSPAMIGVRISYNGYGFEFGDPEIMHSYKHPFLGTANAHQRICLGDRGVSVANKFKVMNPAQGVLSLLDQGKKTLMMGYKTGSNPYIRLNDESGWQFMTKADMNRKKLVCLNEFER